MDICLTDEIKTNDTYLSISNQLFVKKLNRYSVLKISIANNL